MEMRHPMMTMTKALASHHGTSTLQLPAKPDPKIPTHKGKQIFSNNTILIKNIQTTAIQSLISQSPNTFQDTSLSMERSPNIIQQVATTPSLIKTAIKNNVTLKRLEVHKRHKTIRGLPRKPKGTPQRLSHSHVNNNVSI